jgi:hypothetical protein
VVTRTYLFRLEPDPGEAIPETPMLKAYYLTGDGRALQVRELRLRTDQSSEPGSTASITEY